MSQNSYYCTQDSKKSFKYEVVANQQAQNLSFAQNPMTPPKKQLSQGQVQNDSNEQTIQKNNPNNFKTQNPDTNFLKTPRPQKRIILYGSNKQRHYFPLYRQRDIGINKQYRQMVIESWNDDDKRTSSTQMRRGMDQTMNDLYEVFGQENIQTHDY